jgi:predicted NBD/HSP70 family sugar kinase
MSILTLDIGATAIKSALFPSKDAPPEQFRETPSCGKDGGAAVADRALKLTLGYSGYSSIGISTAGQVDTIHGVIIYANDNIPYYTGTRLADIIGSATGVPVKVENDAFCAALGESAYGAARGKDNFMMLTYGTGIGGAIVINGKMEHIITQEYEQYASVTALVKKAADVNPGLSNGRKLMAAVNAGDKSAQRVFEDWLKEVITGLASLVRAFNSSCVVLGGGIMEETAIIMRIREHLNTEILQAALGNKAGLYGARTLIFGEHAK